MTNHYIYEKQSYVIEHVIHANCEKDLEKKLKKYERRNIYTRETHGVTTNPAFARTGG